MGIRVISRGALILIRLALVVIFFNLRYGHCKRVYH